MLQIQGKKVARLAVTSALVAGGLGLAGPAGTASAATARNGACETGEFCLYYLSDYRGSVSDFRGSVSLPNYGASQPTCYEFRGPGAGQGQCVKNNAESVWNRSNRAFRVHYNSNCGGPSQLFASGQFGNLNATLRNDNASHCLA